MPEDFEYYVVVLSESSLKGLDKYVCILHSWIKFRETAGGEVFIQYPMEEKSVTKSRVMNREESSDDWPIFPAEIKHGTNSYQEAINYIKILNKISTQEESKKIVKSVPSTSSQTPESNDQTISTLLSDNLKAISNQTSKQKLTASEESQKATEARDSSPKAKRYFTRLTSKRGSSANTVSVDQTVEIDTLETRSGGIKKSVKQNQKHEAVKICEEFTDEIILREALREVLGDNHKERLGMLYDQYHKRYTMFQVLCQDALEHCRMIKELMKISDGDNDGQVVTPNIEKKASGIQNNDDDIDVTKEDNEIESKNDHQSDKIRGQAREFILPPEYDPEDSRWTLKHREYKEGLVELIPDSQIYVDAKKLSNCKRMSKDSKTLARMLLLEVFRKSALSICSLTGKKANAFDHTGTTVRPGLDEKARNVLLNFVEQHAVDHKWVCWDKVTILHSLRNKMQDMRGKCVSQKQCI